MVLLKISSLIKIIIITINNNVVNYEGQDGEVYRLGLSFDGSKLFQEIEPGDLFFKRSGSPKVVINNREKYAIDYGVECE